MARFATAIVVVLAGCSGDDRSDSAAPRPDPELVRLEERAAREAARAEKLRKRVADEQQGAREIEIPGEVELPGADAPQEAAPDDDARGDDRLLLSPRDRASFERLERRLGGASGLAVSPLGREQRVEAVGSLRTGVAWSTIKVPLSAAALAGGRDADALVRRAITASDNAAADGLWQQLGGGATAAAAVQEQLAAAGDAATRVESRRVRAGFSAFGQTQWRLADQQRYVAGLPCSRHGDALLGLMSDVVDDQRWGLAATGRPAQIKGGWGPSAAGGYTVRQMGVVQIGDRGVAISLITQPGDGAFPSGTRDATAIARWVVEHVDAARAPARARC